MLSLSSGYEVIRQGSRGIFIGLRAEGREPITDREYGNCKRSKREPSGRLQGGG
jgi:hypothetical protein